MAENRKRVRAAFYRSEIKRYLSLGKPVDIDGQDYRPEFLIAQVLAAFREAAEEVYGHPIGHAVLTKPASYRPGDHRNEQMIAAGGEARFSVVELLPEPVAAGFSAPAGEEFPVGSLVLVYDWGGGTFDAALVRVGARAGEVVDSEALPYCGGVDVDEAVAHYVCSRDEELAALFAAGDRGRVAVLDLADRMKRELSARPDSLQEVMGVEAALTVAEFEAVAEPFVERTVECCRGLLAAAQCAPDDLDAVFMAGGSSKIPLVARALEAAFGQPPRAARDRELAVVRGAALWASRSASRSLNAARPAPDLLPLRWDIPGGTGTLIDWLVAEGQSYPAGATLARVRLPDGTLIALNGQAQSVLRGQHAKSGDTVESRSWLATIGAVYPEWTAKDETPNVVEYRNYSRNWSRDVTLAIAAHDGTVYIAAGTSCYSLDPTSGVLQVLFSADQLPAAAKTRSLGNFREIKARGDSLLIAAGKTRDKKMGVRWYEINRRTGAFIREVTK